AARVAAPGRVAVDRDERVGGVALGDAIALAQRHVVVAGAGQDDGDTGRLLELLLELPGDRERDVLLVRALRADRADGFAAVPGTDHHDALRRSGETVALRAFLRVAVGLAGAHDVDDDARGLSGVAVETEHARRVPLDHVNGQAEPVGGLVGVDLRD